MLRSRSIHWDLGTPSMTFLVALDTGSDLFWLPCDCTSCAPLSTGNGFGSEITFYNPNMSMTSQRLPCESNLCEVQKGCSEASQCPYKIVYVSAETSSSGFLVEDILYLTTEDARPEIVEAQIVFGCGQVQTGSFIDAAAPNGLLGLGLEKVSVPSILSSKGLTSDSFSMCFSQDGFGRISFGDQGTSDQDETPLHINQVHPTYNISITGVVVGNTSEDVEFNTLFDTGTSFTYLANPTYSFLTDNFNAQTDAIRHGPDPRVPFEYCYNMTSNDSSTIRVPNISMKTEGGGMFSVSEPGLVVSLQENEFVYCLAVVKSSKLNIIGQNFMTGLRIVFDRERKVLGWKKFNCYDVEDSNPLPVNPSHSSLSPSVRDNYKPEDTKENKNDTAKVTSLTPLSYSPHMNFIPLVSLVWFLLSIFLADIC
ncbi:eukaryotic aspartyl protease family protein isoform X2 [Carex rostrata]